MVEVVYVVDLIRLGEWRPLSTGEVLKFLIDKYGREIAIRFIRVVDQDQDGIITRQEWHRAWRTGEFEVQELEPPPPAPGAKSMEGDVTVTPVYKIMSRHLTRSNLNVGTPSSVSPAKVKPSKGVDEKNVLRVVPVS